MPNGTYWWCERGEKISPTRLEKLKKDKRMDTYTCTLVKKFECCGVIMVTVIIEGKAACVMPERKYNRIIETERKFNKRNKYRVA